jgi:hypothetical protein
MSISSPARSQSSLEGGLSPACRTQRARCSRNLGREEP